MASQTAGLLTFARMSVLEQQAASGQGPERRTRAAQAERQRLAAIPGMVHPHEQAEEAMGD